MRKLFGLIFFIALIFGIWWLFFKEKSHDSGLKQQPLKVATHSGEFNKSIGVVITQYLSLKDAFVNADTLKIKEEEKKLIAAIDSIKIDELKKDTTGIFQSAQLQLTDIRSNADAILKETDITEMRRIGRAHV